METSTDWNSFNSMRYFSSHLDQKLTPEAVPISRWHFAFQLHFQTEVELKREVILLQLWPTTGTSFHHNEEHHNSYAKQTILVSRRLTLTNRLPEFSVVILYWWERSSLDWRNQSNSSCIRNLYQNGRQVVKWVVSLRKQILNRRRSS